MILTLLHLPAILWNALSFLSDGWSLRSALLASHRQVIRHRVLRGKPAMGGNSNTKGIP